MTLRCDVCGDAAMTSIKKDPFGKSDALSNFCSVHAPKFSALHPLPSNLRGCYTDPCRLRVMAAIVKNDETKQALNEGADEIERLLAELAEKKRPCMARSAADPPQDCDAPFCGCNSAWSDCIEMLQECGLLKDRSAVETTPDYIDILFDAPPGPESGRFIEVEDSAGKSIRIGEWVQRDKFWALRIPRAAVKASPESS